ncbi:hypothetical protein [Streptomyces resistomycificus]|uniref:Lipoprotein n=1 Tax=Streptomyces resistomycificus TaxID=67356 RepID=A0A0L8LUN3_9ACTN|nr:hypothetical protein [Streptomyces resistomycificus]KOG41779.1 lipoprotein [Streptomyces resistomycificus]KUN95794.1 hypothetical protein AQJ84_21685 [Streptomyces resistomycificus]
MRRGLVTAIVLAAATVATGCGAEQDVDLVVEGTAPATPYDGPLYVPTKDLDEDGEEAALVESGAAGRALECDGEVYSGGQGETWQQSEGGSTPEEGLELYFDIDQPDLPRSGYRLEREEGDRALFSFDVRGRTKVAVVVAKDQKHRPGWGPETNASCDPAELPAAFTDARKIEVWTDRDGRRIATTVLSSHVGPEHCDWQSVHFLSMGRGADARQYVRDPDATFETDLLTAPYDGDVRLPGDAHDTGYRLDEKQLWLTDDRSIAYVRTTTGVEAWPMTKDTVGCA